MRLLKTSAIVLVPALMLGACGSSTKKVDPAADLAVAKAAGLTAADLPGYKETPYKKSSDVPASVKKDFATCLHVKTTVLDDTPGAQKANSSDFDKGNATVSGSVEIDPKKSDIDTGWNALNKPGIERCLEQLFQAAVRLAAPSGGVTFGATSVTKFDVGVGKRSVGYSVKITASSQGVNVVFYADFVFVARDRAGIELDALNLSKPFSRAKEAALARAIYDRIGTKAS
jgi:hypothetical protein